MGEFSLTSGDGISMRQPMTWWCKLFFSYHVDAMWEMGKHFWKWVSSLLGKGRMPWTPVELEVTVLEPLLDAEARMRHMWGEAPTASLYTMLVKILTELGSVLTLWKVLFFSSSHLSVSYSLSCFEGGCVKLNYVFKCKLCLLCPRGGGRKGKRQSGVGAERKGRDCIHALSLSMVPLHVKEGLDSSITFAAVNKVFELQELDLVFTRYGFLLII